MNSLLLLALVFSAGSARQPVERVIRIDVPSHDAVYRLARQVDLGIIDAQKDYVTAFARDPAIERLRSLGYNVTILVEDYAGQAAIDLANYYTYAQVCSIMRGLAATYPGIARLETLGISSGGRWIPAMKVTQNPSADAGRPRIRLVGAHHGDEKISTEITLAFLQYLCAGYGSDPAATRLVNTREFWIVPILNVDGHVANSRYNNNGRDLNRDYGYEWEVYSEPFSQPETRSMLANTDARVPTLEYTYHSSAAYVNYLWDNHPADPPDSAWIIALSQRYADSTHGSRTTQLEPINGYDWYEVHGSCQDLTFGDYGGLAWTIETGQPTTRAKIDTICIANRRALIDMAFLAGRGINGLVYDSITHAPLFARIDFTAPRRWPTYTSVGAGDFHKMVAPAAYSLRVFANGYEPKTFSGLIVPDTGLFLDVPMTRPALEPWLYVQKVVTVKRVDNSHVYSDWVYSALGEPDGAYYTVGPGASNAVFDVDRFEPVRNRLGYDVTVYATGSYTLAAANDWRGPWYVLGNASGNASFDLGSASMDSARYLKVSSNGSPTLDAIRYLGRERAGIAESPAGLFIPRLLCRPNPARGDMEILLAAPLKAPARVRIINTAGRAVRTLSGNPERNLTRLVWNLNDDHGRPVSNGVYFCCFDAERCSARQKLVVERH